MQNNLKRLLFLLFFLSGFCGLLYQVVWVRISFASFGVITPVLSVVISVFMLGLFVGSWLAGKAVGPLTSRTGLSAIWFYALAELLIGIGAFAVPCLYKMGEAALLPAGAADSTGYLFWSALIITGAILPWCVFMGTTFPLMMAFAKERSQSETTSFSFLYLANVIGAMAGTLVTAIVLVELLGFRHTLLVAAGMNFFIAALSAYLGTKYPYRKTQDAAAPAATPVLAPAKAQRIALILFTTGFTSMAMEVVWTRAFTVVLQTQVYSFALLLFVYLLATWMGSLRYRKHLAAAKVYSTEKLLVWLSLASCLPITLNDPRLHLLGVGAMISIFPFCALLGYLTPKLIDEYSGGNPKAAGFSYALNIFGCIVGPLFASYLLLPAIGLKYSLLFLALPYFVLLPRSGWKHKEAIVALGLLLIALVVNKTYEDQAYRYQGGGVLRRDHTATVISYGTGMDKRLLVNGIGITGLTPITKVMAHLPLAYLSHEPQSALVICFGMGTTFRSLLTWGIDTTAVELVPSVRDAFPYYYEDAPEILKRSNAHIIVDDGRRFLRRTTQSFDVITLDPPPPVEAAGSSLLYSEEFYKEVKARLKPGGILQQWLPATKDETTIRAVTNALKRSFPYVKILNSKFEWGGHHFLATLEPLPDLSSAQLVAKIPLMAQVDMLEWAEGKTAEQFLDGAIRLKEEATSAGDESVTDDRPVNEYFLLRRAAQLTK